MSLLEIESASPPAPVVEPKGAPNEAALLALLRQRHTRPGNGGAGEYAFLTHVRDAASFSASRTLDALALSLWPSRGLELHGFELKCSRADWLRELREPAKAEVFVARCDRFSLVAAHMGVVGAGELPPTWGLLVAKGRRLVTVVAAPKLPRTKEEQRVSRSWLVCLLRAAGAVPEWDPQAVREAREEGERHGRRFAEQEIEALRTRLAQAHQDLNHEAAARTLVYEALGLPAPWRDAAAGLEKVAAAVRVALAGETAIAQTRSQLLDLASRCEHMASRAREAAGGPA